MKRALTREKGTNTPTIDLHTKSSFTCQSSCICIKWAPTYQKCTSTSKNIKSYKIHLNTNKVLKTKGLLKLEKDTNSDGK